MSILFMLFLLNLEKRLEVLKLFRTLCHLPLFHMFPHMSWNKGVGWMELKNVYIKKSSDQKLLIREASVLLGDVCIQLQADSSYANTANFLFYFISGA